ncbi:MAG: gliding motility-associated C-terminal domain-containing protein [Bacteroidales bacterium]
MKKLLLLFILLAFSGFAFSQNLVINPGFETVNTGALQCDMYSDAEFDAAITTWTSPTSGSSDLYHTSLATSCRSCPNCTGTACIGNQTPHGGSAMVGIITHLSSSSFCSPNYREYIQGTLSSALVVGQEYCVEFWVSSADDAPYATNNIGIKFYTTAMNNTSLCPIGVAPDYNYPTPITNTSGWTLISYSFTATAAYRYFIIGNFYNNAGTTIVANGGSESTYAYYFIDDVSVELCSSNPVVTVNSPTICSGQSATLTAAGANTYSWSTGSTGASITVSPTTTTSYTVTGTSAGGTGSAVATVTVNPTPTVNVSASPTSVCPGVASTLTASGAASYSWSTGASGSSISVTPSTTTTYTVTGSSSAGCTNSSTATVVTNTAPTVTVAGASICQGASATLTASGAAVYTWNTGATTASITVSPASTTIYTVTGTNAVGCTGSATATLTVNPIPNVSVSASPASVCPGNASTLTASGAATYLWSTGATGGSISVSPASTTTYSVTGTSSANCSATGSVTVTTLPGPVVSATGAVICAGNAAAISASGANNYTWSDGSTGASVSVSPSTTTVYTVSGTDGSGCTGVATATVTVNPLPVITINSPAICSGATADLTATGAATYLWNTGSTANPLQVTPSSTTSYTVTGSDLNNCSNTASATVIVNASPALTLSSTDDYCNLSDGTATVVAAGGLAPYSYAWNTSPAQTSDVATGLAAGQYEVTVSDANGCQKSGIVTVFALAGFTLNSDSEVEHCMHGDGSATITALNAVNPLTYSWSHNASLNSATANNLAAGTYSVTASDGGCSQVISVTVGSYSGPVAGYHVSSTVVGMEDGPVIFSDMSSGAIQWFYDFGDGANEMIQNPTHQYINSGTYNTMQVVTDEFGCLDTAYQLITVTEGFAFFVPSAFSPNGDGRNDYFNVYGYGVDPGTFNMAIFDRWGEMVFYTTDINHMWDGGRADAKKQEDVSQSVYSYHITFKTLAGKDKEFFGRVITLP